MKSFKCFTKEASMKPVRFAIVITLLAAGMGAAVARASLIPAITPTMKR